MTKQLRKGSVKRIVLTRPEAGESLGFYPVI